MEKKICYSLCAVFVFGTMSVFAAKTPYVFNGPTVTNSAGRDGWCETQMTNIVVQEGSALDLSGLVGNGVAGQYGWAKPFPDGSLRFENRPNEKVRFYGSVEGNIGYHRMLDGCKTLAERHKAIDSFVAQMKRMGMNFIRPHGLLDSAFNITSFKSRGVLSEDELDERDYFLAACKRAGIYVYIDIAAYVLRDREKKNQTWKKAGVMVKEPSYWKLWEDCALGILNRTNKYTRIPWKDDPAVIGVMEYNEQATGTKYALQGGWKKLDPIIKRAYVKGFADWLAVNAPGVKGISEDDEKLPGFYGSDPRGRLLHRYLSELFINRAADYNSLIRSTGYKGILTTYNSDVDYGATAARWKSSEAVAYNFHVGHPHGGGHGYKGAKVSQRSVIDAMVSGSAFCYGNRIRLADSPFIVTENSHAFWNYSRYEASLMLPAYGSLNGYSGILWHEGAADTKAVGSWPRGSIGVFRVSTSPLMRAATFLGAMLFHRGDVSESTKQVAISVNNDYWKKYSADAPSTTQARLGLVFKYGLMFPDLEHSSLSSKKVKADVMLTPGAGDEIEDGLWVSNVKENESKNFDIDSFIAKMKSRGILPASNVTSPKDGVYQSVTGEITLDASKKELCVITPRTEAVCLQAGKNKKLEHLTIDNTSEDCCAALTSIDSLPLSKSKRMVFLWMTRESNQNMITSEDGKTMVSMGSYPALLKGGKISFTANVKNPKDFALYLLDYSGARLEKIPLSTENGKVIANIDTAKLTHGFTPFFELVAECNSAIARDNSPKEYIKELGLRKGERVVILGDSLTNQGLGVRNGGYVHRLTNALSRVHGEGFAEIIPLGYSGWHIPAWRETEKRTRTKSFRNDTCGKFWDAKDVLDSKADVVIIFLGMNDILHPVMKEDEASQKSWIEDYKDFIGTLRKRLSPRRILLCTISPLTTDPQSQKNVVRCQVNERIRRLALDEKCGIVEIDRAIDPLNDEVRRNGKSRLVGDFVHPSWGVGHAAIAQAMAEALGEREAGKILAKDVCFEVEKVLDKADAFSVNQTAIASSLRPDANEFDYEIAWFLKPECGNAKVSIEVPQNWKVIDTNTVSVIPFASEPRFFKGTRGYFTLRGSPKKEATIIKLTAKTKTGKVYKKAVKIPAPWRAQNNSGEWKILSPSWDYSGWGNASAVDPFQSFFGFTNETLKVFRKVYVPSQRKGKLRLATPTFSARLDLTIKINGNQVGSCQLRSGKKLPPPKPILIELNEGWNTIEIDSRHTRSQRQFICELISEDGKAMDDILYDWRF
ncbi:MAG: hypothetical protein J6V88_04305 [Kiritimatiellae bacterium]|nr:hypothetical protein [Kiritimatiellia bacterium]